jgi:alpha-N-acetylglucosaminidase
MKRIILILWVSITCGLSIHASKSQIETSKQLIDRVISNGSKNFIIEIKNLENRKDYFEVDKENEKVKITGNTPVSIATGFNWYLKNICKAHVSWCGNQLNLPKTLPLPKKSYKQVIEQKYRVNFNYCTLNYTASWWNWERWEQELDFMAMNGINMPLSVIGLEAVWYNTLRKYKFSDKEARNFLVGPAYFGWQWMTNIQSHTGALPMNWINKRIELGKKIINRQLELGMMPIQQGFSGYVPKKLKEKFPKAKILEEGRWCNFPGTFQLDPLDPLFKKIGKTFFEEQEKLFGAHHYYACDPFHEGHPPSEEKEYLNQVGKNIFELMNNYDPKSKWVMQAWSIRKDIATTAPKDKLLVLDLNGSKCYGKDFFWGYDFVVGNLHNFGGRINMHGDLPLLASNKYINIKKKAPNAIGTGYFMEGIIQNPVYYDLAFELGISSKPVNLDKWLNKYAERRYGAKSETSEMAWALLARTIYKRGTDGVERSSIIAARPAINTKKSGPNAGLYIPYNNKVVLKAIELLLIDSKKQQNSDAYRYDMVDLTRQLLTNYGQKLNKQIKKAYEKKDLNQFKILTDRFLNILKEVDNLLSTREEFSFPKWVKDARSWGITEEEKNYYELNASMLVTLWGPLTETHEPIIFDYSWREWHGLIGKYYYQRWKKFYDMITIKLTKGEKYTEKGLPQHYGREAFRANDFYNELANWEIAWVKSQKKFIQQKNINELQIVKKLVEKYTKWILE